MPTRHLHSALSALLLAATALTPALPWHTWSDLAALHRIGGHDGDCPGLGAVMALTVAEGDGPTFRMWQIWVPARHPADWAAVEFAGPFADAVATYRGRTGPGQRILVDEARPYDARRDTDACAILGAAAPDGAPRP